MERSASYKPIAWHSDFPAQSIGYNSLAVSPNLTEDINHGLVPTGQQFTWTRGLHSKKKKNTWSSFFSSDPRPPRQEMPIRAKIGIIAVCVLGPRIIEKNCHTNSSSRLHWLSCPPRPKKKKEQVNKVPWPTASTDTVHTYLLSVIAMPLALCLLSVLQHLLHRYVRICCSVPDQHTAVSNPAPIDRDS